MILFITIIGELKNCLANKLKKTLFHELWKTNFEQKKNCIIKETKES